MCYAASSSSIDALRVMASPSDEFIRLARVEFYSGLRRRAPTKLISIPSYVSAVKRKYNLASKNQARQVLATVEGFRDWAQLMRAALAQ